MKLTKSVGAIPLAAQISGIEKRDLRMRADKRQQAAPASD
jgi:hypothetical protein